MIITGKRLKELAREIVEVEDGEVRVGHDSIDLRLGAPAVVLGVPLQSSFLGSTFIVLKNGVSYVHVGDQPWGSDENLIPFSEFVEAFKLPLEEQPEWARSNGYGVYESQYSEFSLSPGQLLLAPTLEKLALPGNVMGFINLRSYSARVGLIQSTALKVSPGFRGYPVLEISSVFSYVGMRIGEPVAQIILMETTDPVEYEGRYQDQDFLA